MEIIEIPEEHISLKASSNELRAIWKTWRAALEATDEESFLLRFNMTKNHAWELDHKLSEAFRAAQENTPRD